jgi:hypothetical protein
MKFLYEKYLQVFFKQKKRNYFISKEFQLNVNKVIERLQSKNESLKIYVTRMKSINEYIYESINTNLCYGIEYAANEQDILSFKYQTSLERAQNFIRKMQTQGMLISCIYEVTSNNWDEFKKLSRSRNMDRDKLKELSNEYFRKKEDINNFLNKK